jgi:hypothetical protein
VHRGPDHCFFRAEVPVNQPVVDPGPRGNAAEG